jgi:hypothetical protein
VIFCLIYVLFLTVVLLLPGKTHLKFTQIIKIIMIIIVIIWNQEGLFSTILLLISYFIFPVPLSSSLTILNINCFSSIK